MSTEAMKLALEALEWDDCYDTAVALKEAAIERLRKAIAEAEKQKPKREWVGLTDEEIKKIAYNSIEVKVARAIEAKLKEKNT